MFCDTHFHFQTMVNSGVDGVEVLRQLSLRNFEFGLDIGTSADDLEERQASVETALKALFETDAEAAKKIGKSIYFTAGIWPSLEEIHNQEERMRLLEESISKAGKINSENTLLPNRKIIAIGECGLDHHWNPSGVDGRSEADFDSSTYVREKSLFALQLELAKKLGLPLIIHSRDAFEDTLEVIDKVGYHNGIIHCYSYGLQEAKAFVERGWHIAFGGGVTYTKKSKMEEMKELLRFVPENLFLCETDSPYLAPVPFRGTKNSPVLVEEVYKFIAEIRCISPEQLSALVYENSRRLFKIGE